MEPTCDETVALEAADVVLVRHGQTTWNARDLLNGDPAVAVHLSAEGRRQCLALAPRLAGLAFAAVYVTRFTRTVESLALLAPDAPPPTVLADLDDIALGELEGKPRAAYVEWRRTHGVDVAPEGGESRLAALRRYARGLAWLAAEAPRPALVVTHDQPLRYLLNAFAGGDPILGPFHGVPNAVPYGFGAPALARGAALLAADPRLATARA